MAQAATATSTKQTTVKVVPEDAKGRYLTPQDVMLLQKRAALAAELKRLDALLKPRIEATCRRFGPGVVAIGEGNLVKLDRTVRQVVSWKSLAEGELDADHIERVKSNWTVESESYKAEVLTI